jgi:hypothetical protein
LKKRIEHTKTAGPSELTLRKRTDIEIEQLNLTQIEKGLLEESFYCLTHCYRN